MTADQVLSVFLMAGYLVDPSKVRAIPNEYLTGESDPPWYEVDTFYGKMKIGWRKRVVNIDWSQTGIQVENIDSIIRDDVTKTPSNVHAYSSTQVINYLSALRPEFAMLKQ